MKHYPFDYGKLVYEVTPHMARWESPIVKSSYRKKLGRIRLLRPNLRSRTSGPVGPEIDWSVRYSDVPMQFIYLMNPGLEQSGNFAGIHGGMHIPPLIPDRAIITVSDWKTVNIPEHDIRAPDFASTFLMSDDQVVAWTKLAQVTGMCYSGIRGYTKPKRPVATPSAIEAIRKYIHGVVTKPRSNLRGFKRLRKKMREFSDFSEDQPGIVIHPYSISSRRLRDLWFSEGKGIRFTVFKERFRKPTLGLVFKQGRVSRINEDIKGILYKIYSKRELSPVRKSNFDWVPDHQSKKPILSSPNRDVPEVRSIPDYLSTLRHGYAHRIVKVSDLFTFVRVIGGMNVTIHTNVLDNQNQKPFVAFEHG